MSCLCFYGYYHQYFDEHNNDKYTQSIQDLRYERNATNFKLTCQVYIIQITLLYLILQVALREVFDELDVEDRFSVRLTQAICAFLLHVTSYKTVESAIAKIRFIYVSENLTDSNR